MATITLNELHEHTEQWLRGVEAYREIIVTDKGRPVARIQPIAPDEKSASANPFLNRKLLPGFAELQARLHGGTDSTQMISEDREGR